MIINMNFSRIHFRTHQGGSQWRLDVPCAPWTLTFQNEVITITDANGNTILSLLAIKVIKDMANNFHVICPNEKEYLIYESDNELTITLK